MRRGSLHCRADPCRVDPPSTAAVGLFYCFAVSEEAVAPVRDGAAGAGETQVVWSDVPERAAAAAEAAIRGGVGSSSGMISSDPLRFSLSGDRVSAKTVEC